MTLAMHSCWVVMPYTFVLSPLPHLQRKPIRKAFEGAVLVPSALKAQAPYISLALSRLVERLTAAARAGQPVDCAQAASDLTMDVISFAAFGLDIQATVGSGS